MKIFVVTSGCYSDTEVVGAYTTQELAEKAKNLAGEDGCVIEIDADKIPKHEPGRKLFCVWMKRNGDTARKPETISAFDSEEKTTAWTWMEKGKGWTFCVWAKDAEHAVKIANEKRVVLIAHEATTPPRPPSENICQTCRGFGVISRETDEGIEYTICPDCESERSI